MTGTRGAAAVRREDGAVVTTAVRPWWNRVGWVLHALLRFVLIMVMQAYVWSKLNLTQMGRADYQEAWAWVHYLLHDAPGGQELLVEYCRELRKAEKPPHFYDQVAKSFPDADLRLASYISLSLTDHGRVTWASGEARVGKPEVRPE